MYFQISTWSIIFLSCLVAGFIWCVLTGRSVVPLLVLGIVWNTYLPYGITWNGAKILVICIGVLWILRPKECLIMRESLVPKLLFLLCLYVVAITIWGSLIEIDDFTLNSLQPSIFQRAPLRAIIATGFWLFGPVCLFIGYSYTSSFYDIDRWVKVVLVSSSFTAIVAISQFITYYIFPSAERVLSFFSVNAYETAVTTETASGVWGLYRPSPFCAEPRYFAFAMAFAAAIVILSRRFSIKTASSVITHSAWIPIYFGLCFVSASTSGMAGMLIGIVGILLWINHLKLRQTITRNKRDLTIAVAIVFSLCLLIIVEFHTRAISQRLKYYLQVYGLLNPASEWFQGVDHTMGASAYLAWLLDTPTAFAFGVGPGNAAFHAFQYCATNATGDSAKGLILNSRFPIIDLVGSIGLIGLLYLVLFWRYCWRLTVRCPRVNADGQENRVLFLRGILVFLMLFLLFADTTLLIWLVFGILLRLNDYRQHTINQSSLLY